MNWVDLVIVALILFFAFEGYGRSFIGESLDLLSFVLALLLSLRFYNLIGSFVQNHFQIAHSLANVIGFFIVWSLVELILALVIHYFVLKGIIYSFIDNRLRSFSILPAVLRGMIFIAVILVLIATFPIQPSLKLAVSSSKVGSKILSGALELEGPLKNVFGGVTQDTLTFLTVEPKTNENVNLGFQTTNFHPREDLEKQMIDLVNQERTKRGIKALTFDPQLVPVAREHSEDMFERGYFSHYSPEGKTVADRAQAHNISFMVIGENLAYAPSLALAHNGLMNSPGHRANILSEDFNKIGIGIEDGGVYGLMITQVFTN